MKILIGAYAAYSSAKDPQVKWEVLESVLRINQVRGLEIPITKSGKIFTEDSPSDYKKFVQYLPAGWRSMLTSIPGTIQRLGSNPQFGLASDDEEGRLEALQFLKSMKDSARELNERKGELAIDAVEIHSAPRVLEGKVSSSVDSLRRSLAEIESWTWDGIELLLEHCDRFQNRFPMAKGFLSLEEEVSAIESLTQSKIKVLINWGRSVLEERKAENAAIHIQATQRKGLLGGVMFSGVTPKNSFYGEWQDTHAPFEAFFKDSLMSKAHVLDCLRNASSLERVGFKIQALPEALTAKDRGRLLEDSARYLLECLSDLSL